MKGVANVYGENQYCFIGDSDIDLHELPMAIEDYIKDKVKGIHISLRVRFQNKNIIRVSSYEKHKNLCFVSEETIKRQKILKNLWTPFNVYFSYSNPNTFVFDIQTEQNKFDLNAIAQTVAKSIAVIV